MSVLTDSWNYVNLLPPRTGAVWDQVDNDVNNPVGWIQSSNTPCQNSVQVCGFSAGMQSNWLITQLINRTVNGTRLPQVRAIIEFQLQECRVQSNCQRTFNTYKYETSSEDNTARRTVGNYQQVERVSPDEVMGMITNATINIDLDSNRTSFYFAIEDETSCIAITRVIVFYHVCPSQSADLIRHPETIAPRFADPPLPPVSVTASCVDNADSINGVAPKLICSNGGTWSFVPGAGCQCRAGYFNDSGVCRPCPARTYSSPSNRSCSLCPANSVSESEGLTQCTCVNGYYRAVTGQEDLSCNLPPSPPQNVRVVSSTEDTITLTWEAPEYDGGRGGLVYGLYYQAEDVVRMKFGTINGTSGVITGLLPGQSYTVFVTSENGITDQVPDSQFQTLATSIQASTTAAGSSVSTEELAIATTIPSFFALVFLLALISVTILLIRKQLVTNNTQDDVQENAYYDTKNVAYEKGQTNVERSTVTLKVEENVAYGVHIPK